MSQDQIEILKRALKREKAARKASEKILEDKSRELFVKSKELKEINLRLNDLIDEKSSTLKGIFENINDAYIVMNLFGNVLKMNEVAIGMFGYDIEKENFNIPDIIHKEDAEYAYNSFTELQEKGFFNNYTARIYTKSKEVKWVRINASLIYDKNNIPIAAQGIVRDITNQRASEDKLIESENRLSSLIINLDSAVLLEDENRKIVLTNLKFCELFKIPVSPELLKGQDCANAAEDSKKLFQNPEGFTSRISVILKNREQVLGDELIMLDGTVLERDFIPVLQGNEYKGHLWAYKNVTLSRQYRKNLEAQKQKYSSIIANMNLGLIEVNTDDEILMINQGFSDMSGYKEEELLGKKGIDVYKLKSQEGVIDNENLKRKKGISNSYELKVKHKNGEFRYWLISGAPNYNLNGQIIGFIGIHLDITQIRALEFQKEKINKELEKRNEELKEYAHVVSHDLKSPLRSIDALVSWIKLDNIGRFDEVTLENFDLIATTLETMEKLISDILEYSSAGSNTLEEQEVDLNETINDLKTILFIPKNIYVKVVKTLPILKGDRTKFQQLFQNFISNAIKFNDKELGIVEIDFKEEKTFYQFSIKDNGIGIEKKYHHKIFQVFHSLNARRDSTGIGLSIIKKIIELYKGDIWLESKPNIGTTFYFTLKKDLKL